MSAVRPAVRHWQSQTGSSCRQSGYRPETADAADWSRSRLLLRRPTITVRWSGKMQVTSSPRRMISRPTSSIAVMRSALSLRIDTVDDMHDRCLVALHLHQRTFIVEAVPSACSIRPSQCLRLTVSPRGQTGYAIQNENSTRTRPAGYRQASSVISPDTQNACARRLRSPDR